MCVYNEISRYVGTEMKKNQNTESQKLELPQMFFSIRYAEDYIDFISKQPQGAAS